MYEVKWLPTDVGLENQEKDDGMLLYGIYVNDTFPCSIGLLW